MLLGEPPRTGADWNFSLMGIPVRVTPFFWLVAMILGWSLANVDGALSGPLIILWVLAVFVSLMAHEFGHALAFRRYGVSARVVLYQFGGLAIPDDPYASYAYGSSSRPQNQIVIAAAGPAAQLILVAVVIMLVKIAGHEVPFRIPYVSELLGLAGGTPIPNDKLRAFVFFLMLPSIFWAVLNLLPVYPLDGGQIARGLFVLGNPREGIRYSLMLSIATGAVMAVYGLRYNMPFLGIMFGMLAYSSYQTLQSYSGGGFGGGGHGR